MANVSDDEKYVNELGMTYSGRKRIHNNALIANRQMHMLYNRLVIDQEGIKKCTDLAARKRLEKLIDKAAKAVQDLSEAVDFGWGTEEKRW